MIPYILHVSILIAAGVLFYKLALKRLTFYVLNRWVLMGCLLAAFLLPLMPMPRVLSWRAKEVVKSESETAGAVGSAAVMKTVAVADTVANAEITVVKPATAVMPATIAKQATAAHRKTARPESVARPDAAIHSEPIVHPEPSTCPDATADSRVPVAPRTTAGLPLKILFYLYLAGVVILGLNLLRQMILLLIQRYKGPVIKDGHYRIVAAAGMQGPCSFGNIIFIHPSEYDPETYQQILLHEKVHAGGWHTMDIILAELGIIFQWFNPFIWLFRREMENNLEFLTDRHVLRHPGVERSAYQLSLVKVAAPEMSFNITSNYNQSLLKRRIIMMNAQTSSRHTAWKYFFLLPLFVLLAGVLNRPAVLAQTVKEKAATPAKPAKPAKSATEKGPVDAVPAVSVTQSEAVAVQATPDVPVSIPLVVTDVQGVVHRTIVSNVTSAVEANVNAVAVSSVNVTIPSEPSISVFVSDTSKPSWGDRTEGAWFIVSNQDKKDDKIMIELRGENDDHNWSSSFSVPRSQLTALNGVGKVEFSLTREAGTIHFTGQFDGEQGFGHYKFQPDADYLAHMRQKKLVEREDELMTFFMLDIKKSYVDMVQANGFPDISKGHLISMAALHIDEDYIKSIRGAGYNDISESQLITFKALKIDKPFIDDIRRAGYDHIETSKLITFKSMKIDGDYLRKFPPSTSANDVVTYKSLHIDSAFVASLKKAGYPDLSSRDIVSLKSMKVDPDYIKGFNDIGYKDIPVRTLISFKSMGITPEYVKSFLDVGYQDIPANTLISMKSMNITPAYIKGFMDLGYKDITPHHLTSLKAMNITPEFIKSFNAIGFKDIPVNQLSSLKAMGVTADYVTKMKEKGFVSDDLNRYIRLKNAFE
ncbi:MAG TPA: M56 family metallopeptidase [Puia sp.]|nr:M56 family metallopeptidase [Puia sp.]